MVRTPPKGKSVQTVIFPDELIKRIDEYRYNNHIPARAEAIRHLLDYALQQEPEYKSRQESAARLVEQLREDHKDD